VQPPTSTVSPAWIDPTTGYWLPGPERTLRSVRALAGAAAATPADKSSAAPLANSIFVIVMNETPLQRTDVSLE
jgi:hypothetical protein